jgi:hypothetical protein
VSGELHWEGPITDQGRDVIALMRAWIAGDSDGFEAILDHADLAAVTRVLVGILADAMTSTSGTAAIDGQLAGLQAEALAELADGPPADGAGPG